MEFNLDIDYPVQTENNNNEKSLSMFIIPQKLDHPDSQNFLSDGDSLALSSSSSSSPLNEIEQGLNFYQHNGQIPLTETLFSGHENLYNSPPTSTGDEQYRASLMSHQNIYGIPQQTIMGDMLQNQIPPLSSPQFLVIPPNGQPEPLENYVNNSVKIEVKNLSPEILNLDEHTQKFKELQQHFDSNAHMNPQQFPPQLQQQQQQPTSFDLHNQMPINFNSGIGLVDSTQQPSFNFNSEPINFGYAIAPNQLPPNYNSNLPNYGAMGQDVPPYYDYSMSPMGALRAEKQIIGGSRVKPYKKPSKAFFCDVCDKYFTCSGHFKRHKMTKKHQQNQERLEEQGALLSNDSTNPHEILDERNATSPPGYASNSPASLPEALNHPPATYNPPPQNAQNVVSTTSFTSNLAPNQPQVVMNHHVSPNAAFNLHPVVEPNNVPYSSDPIPEVIHSQVVYASEIHGAENNVLPSSSSTMQPMLYSPYENQQLAQSYEQNQGIRLPSSNLTVYMDDDPYPFSVQPSHVVERTVLQENLISSASLVPGGNQLFNVDTRGHEYNDTAMNQNDDFLENNCGTYRPEELNHMQSDFTQLAVDTEFEVSSTFKESPTSNLEEMQLQTDTSNVSLAAASSGLSSDLSIPTTVTDDKSTVTVSSSQESDDKTLPKKKTTKRKYVKKKVTDLDKKAVAKPQGDQSVECSQCNKIFSRSCYLTQHYNSHHNGERAFRCETCGKRFETDERLTKHKRSHQHPKDFKCDMCDKEFNFKTDLQRHHADHTQEKPYACDICGKQFIRNDHMQKHREVHFKKSGAKGRNKK